MLQLAESCKLQQKIKILVCCSSPSAVKLQQQINILCHPTRPALSCPWFWHFYLHAKHTRGPSWMARRFRILGSSTKWKSSAKNQRIWGYLVDMNNFVRCNYTRSPREHAPKRWAQQLPEKINILVCCNSPSAVNYNRKSIFWCAATDRVL